MASSATRKKPPVPDEPLISPEADKRLFGLMIRYAVIFMALAIFTSFAFSFLNMPTSRFFPMRRSLDTLSMLIVMIPFFIGVNHMNTVRLEYGRRFFAEDDWKRTVASLDSFSTMGQNFLDRTGEAHYLLSIAQGKLGKTAESNKAKQWVLKNRSSGIWAEKYRADQNARLGPKISALNSSRPVKISETKEEGRLRPSKQKRRRY